METKSPLGAGPGPCRRKDRCPACFDAPADASSRYRSCCDYQPWLRWSAHWFFWRETIRLFRRHRPRAKAKENGLVSWFFLQQVFERLQISQPATQDQLQHRFELPRHGASLDRFGLEQGPSRFHRFQEHPAPGNPCGMGDFHSLAGARDDLVAVEQGFASRRVDFDDQPM